MAYFYHILIILVKDENRRKEAENDSFSKLNEMVGTSFVYPKTLVQKLLFLPIISRYNYYLLFL